MKNLRELSVFQVRLFPVDTIPQSHLLDSNLTLIVGRAFQFQGYRDGDFPSGYESLMSPSGAPGQRDSLDFEAGRFHRDEGESILINSLSIEPRRILLQVSGTSGQADIVFRHLRDLLTAVAPETASGLVEEVYKAEETTCIANLEFSFTRLFRREVLQFIENNVVDAASDSQVAALVQPSGFRVKIGYSAKDASIVEHGITLSSMELTIEPRTNTPLRDGIYYTRSPLSTEQHLKLLVEFERLFTK